MKKEYSLKPRVEFYFFGLFSRVVYDLIEETSLLTLKGLGGFEYSTNKKVITVCKSLETALKELKIKENGK